ncbi:MAG: LysR family transcriptional regulator [Myxococcota bacterium]
MHGAHDEPNLAALDMNLLVVLDALLRERHVTRAAAVLGVSQSACSHALARLRTLLGDPLLVRDRQALVLTPRADALAGPLAAALAALRGALAPPEAFAPRTAKKRFTIATADYGQLVVLPPLLARLGAEAPGIDLVVRDFGGKPVAESLASGECDLAMGPPDGVRTGGKPPPRPTAAGIRDRRIFRDRFVCVARRGHPRIGERLDLETYIALPHAFVAPRGTPGGAVDDALAERGMQRRVALMVQHFLVAPWAVASSDLIVTIAERLAKAFAERLPLAIYEPPLALPRFAIHVMWHERTQRDPAHKWLRDLVVEVTREI